MPRLRVLCPQDQDPPVEIDIGPRPLPDLVPATARRDEGFPQLRLWDTLEAFQGGPQVVLIVVGARGCYEASDLVLAQGATTAAIVLSGFGEAPDLGDRVLHNHIVLDGPAEHDLEPAHEQVRRPMRRARGDC